MKRKSSRRSSILKVARPLEDIQNVSGDDRYSKNKRVSFANAVQITEFLKDQPTHHATASDAKSKDENATADDADTVIQISTPRGKKRRRISTDSGVKLQRLSVIPKLERSFCLTDDDFEVYEDDDPSNTTATHDEITMKDCQDGNGFPPGEDEVGAYWNQLTKDGDLNTTHKYSLSPATSLPPQLSQNATTINKSLSMDMTLQLSDQHRSSFTLLSPDALLREATCKVQNVDPVADEMDTTCNTTEQEPSAPGLDFTCIHVNNESTPPDPTDIQLCDSNQLELTCTTVDPVDSPQRQTDFSDTLDLTCTDSAHSVAQISTFHGTDQLDQTCTDVVNSTLRNTSNADELDLTCTDNVTIVKQRSNNVTVPLTPAYVDHEREKSVVLQSSTNDVPQSSRLIDARDKSISPCSLVDLTGTEVEYGSSPQEPCIELSGLDQTCFNTDDASVVGASRKDFQPNHLPDDILPPQHNHPSDTSNSIVMNSPSCLATDTTSIDLDDVSPHSELTKAPLDTVDISGILDRSKTCGHWLDSDTSDNGFLLDDRFSPLGARELSSRNPPPLPTPSSTIKQSSQKLNMSSMRKTILNIRENADNAHMESALIVTPEAVPIEPRPPADISQFTLSSPSSKANVSTRRSIVPSPSAYSKFCVFLNLDKTILDTTHLPCPSVDESEHDKEAPSITSLSDNLEQVKSRLLETRILLQQRLNNVKYTSAHEAIRPSLRILLNAALQALCAIDVLLSYGIVSGLSKTALCDGSYSSFKPLPDTLNSIGDITGSLSSKVKWFSEMHALMKDEVYPLVEEAIGNAKTTYSWVLDSWNKECIELTLPQDTRVTFNLSPVEDYNMDVPVIKILSVKPSTKASDTNVPALHCTSTADIAKVIFDTQKPLVDSSTV